MTTHNVYQEISDKARLLATNFRDAYENFNRARRLFAQNKTLHALKSACNHLAKYEADYKRLQQLTRQHLPNLWSDLRIVALQDNWHHLEDNEWHFAVKELLSIDAAAAPAAAQIQAAEKYKLPSESDKAFKWMYELAIKGESYGTIRRRLEKKPKAWPRYESDNGVKKAINRYAKRCNLPPIPTRKAGSSKRKNTN